MRSLRMLGTEAAVEILESLIGLLWLVMGVLVLAYAAGVLLALGMLFKVPWFISTFSADIASVRLLIGDFLAPTLGPVLPEVVVLAGGTVAMCLAPILADHFETAVSTRRKALKRLRRPSPAAAPATPRRPVAHLP